MKYYTIADQIWDYFPINACALFIIRPIVNWQLHL